MQLGCAKNFPLLPPKITAITMRCINGKKVVLWKIVNIIIFKAIVKRQQTIVKKRVIATVIVMTTVTSTMSIIMTTLTKVIINIIMTMI